MQRSQNGLSISLIPPRTHWNFIRSSLYKMETQFCHLYLHEKELHTWLSVGAQFFNLNSPACSFITKQSAWIWFSWTLIEVMWFKEGMYSTVLRSKKMPRRSWWALSELELYVLMQCAKDAHVFKRLWTHVFEYVCS